MEVSIKIGEPEAFRHAKGEIGQSLYGEKVEIEEVSIHEEYKPHEYKIKDDVLDAIGYTPLIRMNKIPQAEGVKCDFLVKCEFTNPGGSIKDRIARRMVLDAEKSGRIKPGDTLIEATSGNTGIGMALTAAVRGYKMIITIPEKMSNEKIATLKSLGAEVIRTPTEAAWDSPESHIGVAKRLNELIPNSHILDQYSNPSNPNAHYDGTAEEILDQCDGKVDYIFSASGTGGTVAGIGKKIKEKCPNCKIIGVDPFGSLLALPNKLNESDVTSYKVEGTGYDFLPKVLDRGVVDQWVKIGDKDSLTMARRMIREEGILCGGSSGQVFAAAMHYAKEMKLGEGVRCVVILADSIRNYITKHLNDDWMIRCGFMDLEKLSDEKNPFYGVSWEKLGLKETKFVGKNVTVGEAKDLLAKGVKYLPVVENDKNILGYITNQSLTKQIINRRMTRDQSAISAVVKEIPIVPKHTDLCKISKLLENNEVVIINANQKEDEVAGNLFLVQSEDLLNFMDI